MNPVSFLSHCENLDILPAGVIIIRPDYLVTCWNRTVAEWTGIPREKALCRDLREIFPHLGERRYALRIQQVFEGGPAVFFSTQFHPHFIPAPLPGGGFRFQRTKVHPLVEGDRTYAFIFIDDVTELVQQVHSYRQMRNRALREIEERQKKEAERKTAEDALALANQKLNLLSSITRHDILNQVTALRILADLIEMERDPAAIADFAGKLKVLAGIIEEQVDFTRDYQEIGVREAIWQNVSETVRKVAESLSHPGVRIVNEPDTVEILADPLFERVIFNLLDNAFRYGGPSLSEIRVSRRMEGDSLIIVIEDNGAGIALPDKKNLFKRGFGKHTGLGLFLSREILAITGLEIRETGEPGKGARFEILVPPGRFRLSGHREIGRDDTAG